MRSRIKAGRLRALVAICCVVVVGLVVGEYLIYRAGHAVLPLYAAGVAIDSSGNRVMLPPDAPAAKLFPGTRVLKSTSPVSLEIAAEQRAWLAAGTIPGTPGAVRDTVQDALLDIHTLLLPGGALVANWATPWRYVWPRDAAFVAVALARTGHTGDAVSILQFLQRVQPADGVFQARYLPNGSGVPDRRGIETDEIGWALWGTEQVIAAQPPPQATALRRQFRSLIDRSTTAALAVTDRPGALPAPSLDYWEIRDHRLSLGTAAPLAVGLRAAADLQTQLGDDELAATLTRRATELAASIKTRFGSHGYPRYLGGSAQDASIAFLLPPFTPTTDPGVLTDWHHAEQRMHRPGGGVAPGADWGEGVSWTPPTALFAWTAASTGDRTAAQQRLDWLAAHRTTTGALPEKVLSNGKPAGPAPLAWSDALTILTATTLSAGTPTVVDF